MLTMKNVAHLIANDTSIPDNGINIGMRMTIYPYTAVPKNMLISFFIICISVFYSNIILRRILKWMYCANFAQTFKMSQYVPNSLRIQSVVTIHR